MSRVSLPDALKAEFEGCSLLQEYILIIQNVQLFIYLFNIIIIYSISLICPPTPPFFFKSPNLEKSENGGLKR